MAAVAMAAPAPAPAASSVAPLAPPPPVEPDRALLKRYKSEVLAARSFFLSDYAAPLSIDPVSQSLKLAVKIGDEYAAVRAMEEAAKKTAAVEVKEEPRRRAAVVEDAEDEDKEETTPDIGDASKTIEGLIDGLPKEVKGEGKRGMSSALVAYTGPADEMKGIGGGALIAGGDQARRYPKPEWHAPWKLMRIIPGHLGWVRGMCVDPSNEWFATASDDRTIKIWDLASGVLKLTLTGHINSVMAVTVSPRHPYLFSAGLDKQVKCWDLEQNKTIRQYHGHLSGVYSMALHPTLDLLITGGRDSTARVWDIRTKAEVMVLPGHSNTIGDIVTQGTDPQVITGSHDSTIRCWDLVAGRASVTLTNHKKSIRALCIHPTEYTFGSASADNIKVWKCPEAKFLRNISGHNAVVNTMAINRSNVLVTGGDNGSLHMWDWRTGYNFQTLQTIGQPGSLDAEAGIFDAEFDVTGSRLFTCEADKTIKVWKEDESATPESHPINYKPPKKRKRY